MLGRFVIDSDVPYLLLPEDAGGAAGVDLGGSDGRGAAGGFADGARAPAG
jgi:hypothetical protein